jgi:hypothetical protein
VPEEIQKETEEEAKERRALERDRKSLLFKSETKLQLFSPGMGGGPDIPITADVRHHVLFSGYGSVSKTLKVFVEPIKSDGYDHASAAAEELRDKWGYAFAEPRKPGGK